MNYWLRNIGCGLLIMLVVACQESKNGTAPMKEMSPDKDDLIEVNRQLTDKDKDIIEAFIKRKQWAMEFYPDGYYAMIMEEGQGATARDGSVIELRCTIKLLDGTICYENKDISFVVGKSVEIAGLHRAATQLRQGAKARFIFPPHLAYGLVGDRNKIGARSTLLYEIEVVKIN